MYTVHTLCPSDHHCGVVCKWIKAYWEVDYSQSRHYYYDTAPRLLPSVGSGEEGEGNEEEGKNSTETTAKNTGTKINM